MPTASGRRDDDKCPSPLEGVSVEQDFDYSWLSKTPPGYEDEDDDGQIVESRGDAPRDTP